jgi:anti-sigma regulatory factor (Ser/Thr protein kinase)
MPYLHCGRCGLQIKIQAAYLRVENCPRCVARSSIATALVISADGVSPAAGWGPAPVAVPVVRAGEQAVRTPQAQRGRTQRLRERLPARSASVPSMRRAVVEFALSNGVSAQTREDIALAVSEALSNAVIHAYVGRETPGLIALEAQMIGESLEVVISDDGIGMVPRADSPGLGLGLSLMAQATERLRLEDAAPGVRVRMTFGVAGS